MEDLKINIDKLNDGIKNDLPEVKRTVTGEIDLEAISTGKTEKGYIIPDEIFEAYLKELPDGTSNQSLTYRAYHGGKLYQMEHNRDKASEFGSMGAEARTSSLQARRSNREILEEIAKKNTPLEELERLGLENSSDNNMLVAANYAAVLKAIRGDIKALEYIRDTLGEKPTDKISAEVTALTPEDKELLERVSKRLEAE